MIISRLDYSNSACEGLPADQVTRLQRIQNNSAQLFVEKKENEIMLHLSSKNFTVYLWNSAADIRSWLWPIAISKGLYLHIFLHPSAPMNHFDLSDLPKKSYLKSPSETWNLSGNVLLGSWRHLFGTHYQPISEICQHYYISNLTSKPFCLPRLSRRYSTPDHRLWICICFVCF